MNVKSDKAKLELFVAHRSALIDYAKPILGCRARAEDVVQEAYLRFDGIAADRTLDEPVGFLFRIVRNLALDMSRRLGREGRLHTQVESDDLAEDRPSPEALHRDQLQAVMQALDELPERTRMAVRMHRLDGCTLAQIAAHLGVSVGTAHSLVMDGVDHCRRRLRARS